MAEPEWLGSLFFGLIILSFIPGPWQAPVFNGGSAWGGKQLDVWTLELLQLWAFQLLTTHLKASFANSLVFQLSQGKVVRSNWELCIYIYIYFFFSPPVFLKEAATS